jgi:hypothetical protein
MGSGRRRCDERADRQRRADQRARGGCRSQVAACFT